MIQTDRLKVVVAVSQCSVEEFRLSDRLTKRKYTTALTFLTFCFVLCLFLFSGYVLD